MIRASAANSLKNVGYIAHTQGEYAFARSCLEKSLLICREIGDRSGIAYSLCGLGLVAQSQSDYAFARACYDESLTICREIGDRSGIAYTLNELGNAAYDQGDFISVWTYRTECLILFREIGKLRQMVSSLEAWADLAVKQSKTKQAAALWGMAEAVRDEGGLPLSPAEQEIYDRAVAKACQVIGKEALLAVWSQGRSMTIEQAITYTLAETGD